MQGHLHSHMPFGCFQCQFVCQTVKELSKHRLEHSHPPTFTQGNETADTDVCTNGIHKQPQVSSRPKRNFISNSESSLAEDGDEEQLEGPQQCIKRARKAVERDKLSAVDAAPVLSKEYLAAGSEQIYRTHACPKCRRCFKMRSHLQEHLHLHFPDPALQCPTCGRHFTSKSKLRIHRLREAGQKLHQCHLCAYSAVERNAIRRHLFSMHAGQTGDHVDGQSFPCPACGQSFNQSKMLKAHMKTHNIPPHNKPILCFQEGCSFQSSLRKELVRHAAEAHGVQAVECRHHACSAVFQSDRDMEVHYLTHLAYHCSLCPFTCSNKSVFLRHQRRGHHGDDELRCHFCSFITFNPVDLESHVGHLHANEKIHGCSQCSFVTSHKRGLKRHMMMHKGEKPHKCSLCDFRCRDESYLCKHMLTHSDDKNFMCAECGYVTKWKHYLNVHMRKHAGDLRHECDQCQYRCHRMDQLNSHKLRHQAKSLMCEICAYACKRKYELRKHMLVKHSGEEKQPAVYKCKYCEYSTCYRQALQNHENCKHTKLREFRCALCSYCSFSSISLFLHKRKTHGYIPGDKAWLEDYAAKERNRNSTQLVQEFFDKLSTAHDYPDQSTCEGSQRKPSDLPDSAGQETVAGLQTECSIDVLNVVSQEVVHGGVSASPPPAHGPEEYCTLVLTTLSTADYQTHSLPKVNSANQTPNSPDVDCDGSDVLREKADFPTHSSEEDNVAIADADCEQNNSGDYEPSNDTSCFEQISDPELRLKAMRKHDRDLAVAMVLEGRVQMLMMPTRDVYHCERCSYMSSKEMALEHHRQVVCSGRVNEHQCQACGAQFRQRQGLDSHSANKCSTVPQKTRTFVGNSNTVLAAGRSTVGQEGSKQLSGKTDSNQTEHVSAQISTESINSKGSDICSFGESEQQQSKIQTRKCLIKLAKKQAESELFPIGKESTVPVQSLYTQTGGKFQCKLCNFSSVKRETIERHLSTCRKIFCKSVNPIVTEVDNECGDKDIEDLEQYNERTGKVSEKHQTYSCPSCAFRCNQKRALDSHEKRGCLKADDVQCTSCSFLAKSKLCLNRHIFYVHKKKRHGVAKPKRLDCQHCTFTCKQERCMAQHVSLKHKGAQPHCCRYCPFSTTRLYRLEEHESLHTGVGRHSCNLCDKTFGAVTKLRQHKMRIHDKRPTHFCSACDFSGYTLDDVKRHNLRCHTGELRIVCTHCNAQFSSKVALKNHCKRVHQPKVCFSCKQCEFTCGSEVALKNHQESKHTQVKCSTCRESFKTKGSLEIHQKTHLAHQCQLCPFAAKTRQLLAQHLLNEHEERSLKDRPLRCSVCQFACQHQLVLEQHLRLHGGKRLYKCTDCDYTTRNKQKITWHIRIHTGEKPYICEQCSYTCTDPSRLKLHMRVHQEEKKYLCPECGYKCKWATQLKYHMTKHTGDKPYACDKCDYRTNRADALRVHRHTQHSHLRPYICEKCGKAFKTDFVLKTHQRLHEDKQPYLCGSCPKSFRWPAGLRHHYLSHTQQKPFRCLHCSYRAKQKFQVVKHLRRHHPEESVEEGVLRDSEAGTLTLKEALQGRPDCSVLEQEGDKEGCSKH